MKKYNFDKRIKYRDHKGLFIKFGKQLNMRKYILKELKELDDDFKRDFEIFMLRDKDIRIFDVVNPFVFPIRIIKDFRKRDDLNNMRIKKDYDDKYNEPIMRSVQLLNYLLDKYGYILTSNQCGLYYKWLLEYDSIENQKAFINRYLKNISEKDVIKDIEFKKTLKELM